MKMRAKFMLSAFAPEHFPSAARTNNAPEVAFLGRSNVGKSSLINALIGDAMAKVSSTPGRTRSINFFALHELTPAGNERPNPALVLADLPGYGYAKISKSISSEWSSFVDPYLSEREQLALCCCLVDTNIPPQASDQQLIQYLQQHRKPYLVIGTKSDRLSNNVLAKSLTALKREHGTGDIIPVAAKEGKNGRGMKELWARLDQLTKPAPAIQSDL
jgi:GTP-binding protein